MTPLSLTQATAISRKFAIERERLSQEKADVERQLRSLEHGPKEGPKVLPPKLSLPHLPPLPKFNNVPRDTPKSEEEATTTDEPKAASRIQSKSTHVLKEIATLRMEYLKNGGVNPLILEQINQLEARAMTGTIRVKEGQTNNNNTDPTFQAGNHSIDNSNMTAATAAERENLKGITFEEIDMISIPPYDEYRGLSLFLDLVTGVPYFGGGSTAKLDLFYTVFNGATASCPVDTITTTCHRQPVSYVGKAIISEVQRFYDIPSTSKHRLLFQFSTSDSSDSHTDAEIRPIAWTSFDLFNDNGSLNQGRWRLSLFHPPVDFRATTYHLYSNLAIIPNMFLYIRVVHPMLQAHHKRINVSAIDVRNTAAGSEYRIFKPSYNNFEFYDAVQISYLSEKRSMSTILDIPPEISASGNLRGSRVLGSTNTLNMNQVLHCSVGFRVDQLKNLDISSDTNVRVKIMIGNQQNPWVSGFAEMGFTKNTYGWPDDVAEPYLSPIKIRDEDERVISLEPIVLELFLELEDSIVVMKEFSIQSRESSTPKLPVSLPFGYILMREFLHHSTSIPRDSISRCRKAHG
ncbi:hypothetical protein BDR26DRAFT_936029 [Obelidium mucronatum]|nr:hypothetical protein BDR26DRAFT_936029 [Obelidium mucronatum]